MEAVRQEVDLEVRLAEAVQVIVQTETVVQELALLVD